MILPSVLRRNRVQLVAALLIGLGFALLCGCAAFYSSNPRFGGRRVRLQVRDDVQKPVPTDRRQGTLGWPVQGRIAVEFGLKVDPKYGTKTKSNGIDIACTRGSRVKAALAGRVSFADRFMGYGRMVIVDHGERLHTVYSNLSAVGASVGQRVEKGSVLAEAGDTLHFEVRKQGQSVNPLEWLAPR